MKSPNPPPVKPNCRMHRAHTFIGAGRPTVGRLLTATVDQNARPFRTLLNRCRRRPLAPIWRIRRQRGLAVCTRTHTHTLAHVRPPDGLVLFIHLQRCAFALALPARAITIGEHCTIISKFMLFCACACSCVCVCVSTRFMGWRDGTLIGS